MKPATFFLALTLILFFTTHSVSSRAIVDDTIVYDIYGNPLEKDASYYISPFIWAFGGGVTLGSPNEINGTCVADVIQSPFEVEHGTPFTFTPVAVPIGKDVIELGKPLAIQSPTENPCEEASTVWKVSTLDGSGIITTGGIIDTPTSCLRITKPEAPRSSGTYSFEYCPYLCGPGFRICYPIGLYMSNGQRHLSPRASSIFEFVFTKAPEPAVISEVV
ncbi:hypothetical protein D3Z30_13105 [Staphylococcus warneri]|uniref:Uncharacterized protein n=2 Tax=Staphylococcus warneri TaxID=1292 RepID=A0AB36BJT4_STAWA|nr:hypothetical protein [Staphylococcus warneri]